MTKITWKPGTMLAPVPPALISCGSIEKPNVMTAAWTGIISSEPPMTYVSVRPSRHSHEIIQKNGEFVINLTHLPLVNAADWCGVRSGRDYDKFKEMGLTASPCSEISAPQIEESPVSIECKVKSVSHFGTHDMFLAEIVAVNVDDKYIDKDGKLWLEKAGLIAYVHGHYYTLGRKIGKFGFSVEKNPKKTQLKDFVVQTETTHRKNPEKHKNTEIKPRQPKDGYKGKRVFDDRKPRRFSDTRRNETYSDKPSAKDKVKKFDGKSKFEKKRHSDRQEIIVKTPARKHFGKLKKTSA